MSQSDLISANWYQREAARTLVTEQFELTYQEFMLIWVSLGLSGESGEFVDCVKKQVMHRHGLDKEKLSKELGDVLWYAATACEVLDLDMGDIMLQNIEKLRKRYPNGFNSDDSKARRDVGEVW